MKEPINKSLESNWFQINDNIATAIDVDKIAKQYEGS